MLTLIGLSGSLRRGSDRHLQPHCAVAAHRKWLIPPIGTPTQDHAKHVPIWPSQWVPRSIWAGAV